MSADKPASIRDQVLAINRDGSLSRGEKEAKIQQLMLASWTAQQTAQVAAGSEADTEADLAPQFHNKDDNIYGCTHYQRKCKIRAQCCGKLFVCRLCHNENSNHEIDRYATTHILCMVCQTGQLISDKCINKDCGVVFARYYCDFCKFHDDHPSKQIYHCPDCKMCRVGEGLGKDFFHCKMCNMCLNMAMKNNHICIERNMEASCPVCFEFMFTSTSSVTVLKNCGHAIHSKCLEQYVESSYNLSCPVCSKSIGEMNERWEAIDLLLAEQPMPPEFADTKAGILCNDCNEKSVTRYHFLYHKCQHCSSYNTRIVSTENMPVFDTQAAAEAAAANAAAAAVASGSNVEVVAEGGGGERGDVGANVEMADAEEEGGAAATMDAEANEDGN